MKNTTKEVLNHFLSHYPENQKLLDLMRGDGVDGEGTLQSARIPALQAGYYLDGGTKNRPTFQKKFDNDLTRVEKDLLGAEVVDLGELSSILYHPAFALERAEREVVSEDREKARQMLLNILENDPEHLVDRGLKEVRDPIFDLFRDEVFDEEKAISALLPHVMARHMEFKPEDYKKTFLSQFLIPVSQGNHFQHWEEFLSKLSREKTGGTN